MKSIAPTKHWIVTAANIVKEPLQPCLFITSLSKGGNELDDRLRPADATPAARARFLEWYWWMITDAGMKRKPAPAP